MYPLSAVIITFNEEHNIERCIRSVRQVADEIIVLDSFSTDETAHIARGLGATVHQEKFRGYIGQKNFAIKLASHNYILSLDADEALDPKLVNSILEVKRSFSHRAYSMNRCTNFCGRFIRHGLWYPDRKTRLFDRTIARWGGLNPHDKIQLQDNFKPQYLEGDILHYSFANAEDLVWQNNRLSSIAASSLYANGKRSSWFKILVNPAWAFINGYFFRRGFLDGFDGFTIAIHTSHQVFQKYSKLYRLHSSKQNAVTALAKPIIPGTKTAIGEG
ncbi:MAG TPA: glycosyltransferase family 2 protein [Chitinophagaceae bacterium]|jgi:glycosyltransferase involved in cell wall biosynthesis|nr:glycosyltransferase family 2 protein [Chitinophagaceae bacterium]